MTCDPEQAMKDLVQALVAVRVTLYEAEIKQTLLDAVDYAQHNEWGLGLEIVCDNLYEYDFPLPKSIFDQISSLGVSWEIDPYRIAMLRELIVDTAKPNDRDFS